MTIYLHCSCGRRWQARDEFAGKSSECGVCGAVLTLPIAGENAAELPADAGQPESAPDLDSKILAGELTEFYDTPAPRAGNRSRGWTIPRVMLAALLDPRSIHWMLILGGSLAVLGMLVWMTSLGVFENPLVLAVSLGTGTMAILTAGWSVALKTRFRIAGQALTFLGCVVAPLNLWFYHAQQLVSLEDRLWIGGLACSLLYIATVYILRDPVFLYAVEVGITLTLGLFLADMGMINDTACLSLALIVLGMISIHAERAFPSGKRVLGREEFGLPLFWSGHVQIGASLAILLVTQSAGWLLDPTRGFFETAWQGSWLTQSTVLASSLWLAGAYAYVYSDFVARRAGCYTFLAAFCGIMAEVTLVGMKLHAEGLVAVLALTALGTNVLHSRIVGREGPLSRAVMTLAASLSAMPLIIGLGLHVRASSEFAIRVDWSYVTSGWFVAAMLCVALCNRISAHFYRKLAPRSALLYHYFSAGALVVAAAGALRMLHLTAWVEQAPILMLIPIGYLGAWRLWRGHSPEIPLYRVAQVAAGVVMLHVFSASFSLWEIAMRPVQDGTTNLRLGIVFVECAMFYTMAAVLRRGSVNIYLATAAACCALWQFLGYCGTPDAFYTVLYATLGVFFLVISRFLGIEQREVFQAQRGRTLASRGRGLPALQAGNGILSLAALAAICQGLTDFAPQATNWQGFWAVAWTGTACLLAVALLPLANWRRLYAIFTIVLLVEGCVMLNTLAAMTLWQKLELFSVAIGSALITMSYVGRFREDEQKQNDLVSVGLWLGSMLATVPLLMAVLYHRFAGPITSPLDEVGLLTVTLALLVTGYSWHIKSTTFFGGGSLVSYLLIIVTSLGWQQQTAVGVYLAVGGGVVFILGIVLSIFRDRLSDLPDQLARREGIFHVMNWR